MLFNSLTFFGFLILTFVIFWRLNNRLRIQNLFVLGASYFFYGCWDWRFLILIVISSGVDFIIGKQLGAEERTTQRKMLLGISLFVNLGLLGFFKYFNFFIESATIALRGIGFETSHSSLSIILPVGISFYTFQTLSYTIDIYRGQLKPTDNWIEFFAFVSFFPQLVAGPIERASNLLPQFGRQRAFELDTAVKGMRLILWGLFKKMVIADRLAPIVDSIYQSPSSCDSFTALLAGALFVYQVYCDFSGYSDIAIGTARLFGFTLMRNFITPFHSRSMTELWSRWHISLSTWFRDYVYITLGGNRTSTFRWIISVVITFTLSGLWHGADFHFIVWGFSYTLFLIPERLLGVRKIGVIPTFLLFCIPGMFFRASVQDVFILYQQLFSFTFNGIEAYASLLPNEFDLIYTLALFIAFVSAEGVMGKTDFDESVSKVSIVSRWAIYYVLLAAILLFGVTENAPQFIYFQF